MSEPSLTSSMPFTTYDVAKVRRFLGYPVSPQINSTIQTRFDTVAAAGESEVLIAQANLRRLDEISHQLKKVSTLLDRVQLVAEARQLIGELSTQLSLAIWSDIYSSNAINRVVRG